MKYVSKEEYKKQIEQIVMLLEGKTGVILKEIEKDMIEASKKLDYEKAAELRDRKLAIERVNEKQKVSNISENNIDVIGVYKNDISVCIEIFFVRSSRMIDRQHYFLGELKDMEISEIISGFIKQYYIEKPDIPNRIMIQENIEDKESIEKWLESKIKRKVEIKTPQKGEKQRFVEMAIRNAKITLENKSKDKMEILTELKSVLSLDKLPRKIETFDISNISGEYIVAGMCVAEDGIIKRNLSRRFKIKTVIGQDDPKCTEEVVTRRLKHSLENPKGGFGKLPDLILADGGITQIRAIKRALKKYDLQEKILVFGMVKDDTHSTRALINENRKEYEISENLFLFITNFQNEVHNTAIEYHRKLREKDINKSELDSINGIGQKKKELLLKEFKTIDNIREADVNDLLKVKGITFDLAKKIKDKIN